MRDDLVRQLGRRRTRFVILAMACIPLALAAVFVVRGTPDIAPGSTPDLQALAASSALAFTAYVLYLCAPLLLLAVAALFAGEAVAGEAAWGTLRYLLAAPVPRRTLLIRKLGAALALTLLATIVLLGTSLLVGWACFGWGPLETPVGGSIPPGEASARVALAVASILVGLLPFAAIAFLLSVCIDSPLGAVAGSVGVAVVSQILDAVTAFGSLRVVLPTHYAYGWTDLFVDPPDAADVAAGVAQAVVVTTLALAAAWWRFSRRDITS